MEDVMETCYIDSVTMCSRGYKCETCPKEIAYKARKRDTGKPGDTGKGDTGKPGDTDKMDTGKSGDIKNSEQ